MKPIRVSFQCFGAFPGPVDIDLRETGREGLFLICGDTGAGKTTILDAMCYALYYTSSSGSSADPGKGTFNSMRSRYVGEDDKTSTFVELELEKNGERYLFRRTLTPKKRAAGLEDSHECSRWNGTGFEPVIINANQRSVTDMAVQLTGLTADQFRQIIILPQGRFEQLLTSDSGEKEKILSTLFAAERWQKAVDLMISGLNEEKKKLQEARNLISGQLQAQECAGPEELRERIEELEAAIPEKEQQVQAAAEAYSRQEEKNRLAAAEEQLFTELEKRQRTLKELTDRAAVYETREIRLREAQQAEPLRSVWDGLKPLRTAAAESQRKAEAADTVLAAREKLARQAEQARLAYENEKPEHEKNRSYLQKLQNARNAYADYSRQSREATRIGKDLKKAETQQAAMSADVGVLAEKLIKADRDSVQAHAALMEIQHRYSLCAAGRLAEKLEEDAPCPVCGSVHHPAPAGLAEDHVTDAMLDSAEKKASAATDAYRDAAEALKKGQEAEQKAAAAVTELKAALTTAEQLTEAAAGHLIDGIADEAGLEKEIRRVTLAMEQYEQKGDTIRTDCEAAAGAYNQAKGNRDTAREQAEEDREKQTRAEDRWLESLAGAGLPHEQAFLKQLMEPAALESLRKDIEGYRSDCAHARTELEEQQKQTAGHQRPDMAALKAESDAIIRIRDNALKTLNTTREKLSELQGLEVRLKKQAEELAVKTADFNRRDGFAQKLNNSHGLNLHRYVLAAMLDAVIHQANLLLENVHDGRYRLERSDIATGRKAKAGLELNVLDQRTNSIRSVKSLSGGEKFLVSLALAIGLNTVLQAQAHGIRVEAIFVDEGFGTLDSDSVNDAMQMLQTVRRSHGMVGVISHVDVLRNEIPVHIEICKDVNHGSTVKQ